MVAEGAVGIRGDGLPAMVTFARGSSPSVEDHFRVDMHEELSRRAEGTEPFRGARPACHRGKDQLVTDAAPARAACAQLLGRPEANERAACDQLLSAP